MRTRSTTRVCSCSSGSSVFRMRGIHSSSTASQVRAAARFFSRFFGRFFGRPFSRPFGRSFGCIFGCVFSHRRRRPCCAIIRCCCRLGFILLLQVRREGDGRGCRLSLLGGEGDGCGCRLSLLLRLQEGGEGNGGSGGTGGGGGSRPEEGWGYRDVQANFMGGRWY